MRYYGIFGISLSIFLIIGVFPAFAQTSEVQTSEQITLSEDLQNNPVAQDILEKIEQTKKWIAELEARDYEKLESQKELEQKRAEALAILEKDLEEWENLWEYYSPRNSFGRFIEKISVPEVKGVFWDQFEFHEMKVNAGREALKKVMANGGTLSEARQAYHKAAETKRIELIEANASFNVKNNLAYYNQQILFNKEGQFIETPITGEQLRKYYEDYRTNPAYLKANPDDEISWEERSQTNANTQCREGYIVVYRFHSRDYVCVTIQTAEMWIRHGMGEISGEGQTSTEFVTPLSKCEEGYSVIFNIESGKYSCIRDSTAQNWVEQEIAEYSDPEAYISNKIKEKNTISKIDEINSDLLEIEKELEEKILELKAHYDELYEEAITKSKEAEREATTLYSQSSSMTKEELSRLIISIRNELEDTQDNILREKIDSLDELEDEYETKFEKFVSAFDDPSIKIVWNKIKSSYEAIQK